MSSNQDRQLNHRLKNRLVAVMLILITTNLVSGGFLIYEKYYKDIGYNPYPLIDFSRNFIDQKHYLTTINPLREKIRMMTNDFGQENVSVYVEYLNTGANISINPDLYILPASLTKVPLALAVVKKIEKGEWEYQNELVLMPGDANDKSGDKDNPLSEYPNGTRFTIEKLLNELLVNSDNTAYYILLRNLHQDDLKEVIQSLGMEKLFTEDGQISAKEYSRILRSLYTASFLSRANSEKILNWLDNATFNEFLASGLPENIIFPHKYGEDDQFLAYSDSGIVYIPNRPYIISVMIRGNLSEPHQKEQVKAAELMKNIAHETYEYFSQAQN